MEQLERFDNNFLFDHAGHLTDSGLHALQDGLLDDLGGLEAAEHLTFCDFCLARYTALIEAAPERLQQPMRDLIPQVQNLMRLRSFRVMTNRYVSTAAAVVLAFALWRFGFFGGVPAPDREQTAGQPTGPRTTISQSISGALDRFTNGIGDALYGLKTTVSSGLDQLSDPGKILNNTLNNGGETADGE